MSKENLAELHKLESYDYDLPPGRIAQHPAIPRDSSRLLLMNKHSQTLSDRRFSELPQLLQRGDLVVLNNTKVLPARLQSDLGEVLLVREVEKDCWDALVFPGKHFKPRAMVTFGNGTTAEVLSQSPIGRILRFRGDVRQLLSAHGSIPLPPYIERKPVPEDKQKYQTIFARTPGSVAAPTAGLHFTRNLFAALTKMGIETARITLHVGPGTFRPVKSEDITQHSMHSEFYRCSAATWKKIQDAKRVIAVGTTTTRTLETIVRTGELEAFTSLFIYPGFEFRITGGMITNFHLPRSSLLMLVSAFGGYKPVRRAYESAVQKEYRFYSYGDAMLIL